VSETIFETIHGSHLYGLAHEGSDMDVFRVTTSLATKARHHQGEDQDTATVPWGVFLQRIHEGSHQSVEALFSPHKDWNPKCESFAAMLDGYRITGSNVFAKYERTIKKFCYGDFKRRRHAARLQMNLIELRRHGRFNPVMTDEQKSWATLVAERIEGDELAALLLA